MRICIVTHKLQKGDGQGRVNYEVALEALREGHQIVMVASKIDDDLVGHSNTQSILIPVDSWPTELLRNAVFSTKSTRWLKRNRSCFDVLLVNGAITQVPADFNAVHFVHSSWLSSPVHTSKEAKGFYSFYQWFYTRLNVSLEKKAFQDSAQMIAVSNQVARDLEAIGIPSQSIKTITNGVDLEEFLPGRVQRKTLGLPENMPLALFVGDIRTSRKNLDTVLQAMTEVTELSIAIVGGVQGSPYPSLAKDLGIAQRTHFLDYRKDVPQLMQAADFLISPSRYDPFGLVVLEAMASGLAVVTASAAGASELVTPEVGFVVENADDKGAIVNAMKTLSADALLRESMGNNARKIAETFSWQSMAKEYVRLFENYLVLKGA